MAKNTYKINKSYQFINPYNFVNVNFKETKRQSIYDEHEEKLSGVINCKLVTKTPVAIPDVYNGIKDSNGHMTYPFMRNPEGRLMIPGSSLRGVIRSVYETITDSCFVTSDPEQRITKRARMSEVGKPGILKYDENEKKWKLYPAKRYMIIMNDKDYKYFSETGHESYSREDIKKNYKYGQEIYFIVGGNKYKIIKDKKTKEVIKKLTLGQLVKKIVDPSEEKAVPGYLYMGEIPLGSEKMKTNKHFESIFKCEEKAVVDRNKNSIKIDESELELIVNILYQKYNDSAINRCKGQNVWYDGVIDAIGEKRPVPIWYNLDNHDLVLSLAAVGRIAYKKSLGVHLGEKTPCTNRKELCKACSLFGMVGEEGVGSRIRVTDALVLGNENKILKDVTLKELGSPRISYLPFYATPVNGQEVPVSYDNANVSIRGRKYYWHTGKKVYGSSEKTKRNATMELVDQNEELEFNVYFDSITKEQLEELKWVLTLGENKDDNTICHKIGHGKPIGLGSVKVVIDGISFRTYSENGYSVENIKKDKITINNPNSIPEDLLTILDMVKTENVVVRYPYVDGYEDGSNDNDLAAHQWFGNNENVLPAITDAIDNPLNPISKIETSNMEDKKSNKKSYEENMVYTGVVQKYNDKKTTAIIKLNNSYGTASIYYRNIKGIKVDYGKIDSVLDINSTVELIYKGQEKSADGKSHDIWEYNYKGRG